ncbi:MAG: ATP-binding protein [Rhizobiales bacterium]|nr:ATP-binding protein [Hyphomicrobiales bacterium]
MSSDPTATRNPLLATALAPPDAPQPDPLLLESDRGRALAQAIVDTIREPLLVLDRDLRVVLASRSFYKVFKVGRQDVQGRPVHALGNGQWDIPELRLLLDGILRRHTVMEAFEVAQDFPGLGPRTMLLNARALFYRDAAQTTILLAIEDITERRVAERETTDLLRQKETLLEEMQHRVANSLQIIASILLLKARTVQSEETRRHLHDAHQRIMSVATMQQHLRGSRSEDVIELGPYLTRLCETLAASMIGDSRPITLKVEVDRGTASSSQAVSLGLIVTELVINALKHAFPGEQNDGRVVVAYDFAEPNWRLSVSDNGIGRPPGNLDKTKPGLGTSIIEALARQLGAGVDVSMDQQGTIVSITHAIFAAPPPATA